MKNINIIYKSLIVPVNCNKTDYAYLSQCNKYSAIIWNMCVKADEDNYNKTKKFLGLSALEKINKQRVPHITASSINSVVIKYMSARNAMFESRKVNCENNKIKLPYKEKKYYNTYWSYQTVKINKEKGYITLSKPLKKDENGINKIQKPIKCYLKFIPDNIVEIELVYRNKLYLIVKYKIENNSVLIQSNNVAAIDLGEIHSIASIDTNGNAIIITGRKLRSDKRLRNKEQAAIYKRMSKCKRGSKQYKKYMRALNNLKTKYDFKILDSVHKITKLYEDYCIQNDIGTVYYGDLDSCSRGTKQDHVGGRVVRQKLSQWNFGEIMQQLENKLSRHGIQLIKVKEYYTSKKCPVCGKLNKPNGRNYECECGYIMHRDVNGAINILNDNGGFKVTKYNNLKYLRVE